MLTIATEDAPALDPIAKFEIIERGSVFIKGEESILKANRRKANHTCKPSGEDEVVVIGG